jgi:ABC-type multidrug transport system ATPase subunit
MSGGPVVLQAEGLCFGWPERPLWNDWSVRIPPGVTLVRGEESTGKSTLLRLLAGDLAAQSGVLQVNGVRVDLQPQRYREQAFWTDLHSTAHDAHSAAAWFQTLPSSYPHFSAEALAELVDGFSLAPHLDKPLYMRSIDFLLELLQDVADHPARAWVVADYTAPAGVPLAAMVELAE